MSGLASVLEGDGSGELSARERFPSNDGMKSGLNSPPALEFSVDKVDCWGGGSEGLVAEGNSIYSRGVTSNWAGVNLSPIVAIAPNPT